MNRRLMAAALVLALVVPLGACQGTLGAVLTTITNPIKQPIKARQVYQLRAAYDAAFLAPAANYARLPRCSKTPQPCSEQRIVNELRKADKIVQPALDNAEAFVRNNPTLDARAVYDLAQKAIEGANAVKTAYGIGG